ncbi:hypothetical protein [Streptomyces sp. HUAS ZL42]|uniref:hypothetical protein n=1 Tax=Streptomyces sp. HUAS ZL42 TaxID=3231715 RepID=UPI00345E1744
MTQQQLDVPHKAAYNFGVGVDVLSGTVMNLAVTPTTTTVIEATGADHFFKVARVTTTEDLQTKLGIGVDASYGAFGAGVSGRFAFTQQASVHSASLFMTITATVHQADLSIQECVLTPNAAGVADRPDLFKQRYGEMFARACRRGGLFVGLMQVETFDESEATSIEGELRGSYGFFSASATTAFKQVTERHNSRIYCTVYSEGGPAIQLERPDDPTLLLAAANKWMQAMQDDPARYSRPYQWTLSPLSIAEGPLPPNEADIAHAQDVLKLCADQRLALMDQYNLLDWWAKHPDHYEWARSFTPAQANQAAADTQRDLDTVAECASAAIDHPKDAVRPAEYAAAQGRTYPLATLPAVYPKPKPGPVTVYSEPEYKGASQMLRRGRYDDADGAITIGNDAIQSVYVPAQLVVRLYEHFHFQGQFIDVHESTPDLNSWNRKTSSLIVYGEGEAPPRTTEVVVVQLPNLDTWDGPSWIFSAADGRQAAPQFAIRSAHIPDGMMLSVYPGPDFTGTPTDYTQDTLDVGDRRPGEYSFIVRDLFVK